MGASAQAPGLLLTKGGARLAGTQPPHLCQSLPTPHAKKKDTLAVTSSDFILLLIQSKVYVIKVFTFTSSLKCSNSWLPV